MRYNISITIDEDTMVKVQDLLRSKIYRNKSHFFEIAANKLIEESGDVH